MTTYDVAPLAEEAQAHLQRLMATWGTLADLSFSDLLLFVPVDSAGTRFTVYGQMRPTTSQTLHHDDLVGRVIDEAEHPLVVRAWALGEIVEGEVLVDNRRERARAQCIPVRWRGDLLAVLTREAPYTVPGRRPGELERVYVEAFDRLAQMISRGEFPYPVDDAPTAESPRPGDGLLLLDGTGRVEYASPNAVNALHRLGVYSSVVGLRLDEIGVEETAIQRSFFQAVPLTEEVERDGDAVVLVRCIPLLDDGEVTGALVLVRDVTDVRRRDRLLISKDATIREVHHRVKNNLQTISSLLRLQGRRLAAPEARVALEEAERRVRSIAIVHEILSRDPSEQVPFGEILDPLVRMAHDGALATEHPVRFSIDGEAGELPPELATPLAVVIAELLQNAVEHAFPAGRLLEREPHVEIRLRNDGTTLHVQVRDNGVGYAETACDDASSSLGLSIVRELVTSQLGGKMDLTTDGGTLVDLHIPVATRRASTPTATPA